MSSSQPLLLECKHFSLLFDVLRKYAYETIGPTVQEGAIVYSALHSSADLPIGVGDDHAPGKYLLKKREDRALFGFVVGPHSWKKFLFPPAQQLWSANRNGSQFQINTVVEEATKYAFIGVRPCELAALSIQDRVFINSSFEEPFYKSHRERLFIVAVNCTQPGATCFCASMKSGPKAASGYDLALTEIIDGEEHYFIVDVGSKVGQEIFAEIPHREATPDETERARRLMAKAAKRMGRQMDTTGLKDLLYRNYENQHWNDVASRCLTCANCTLVCPTCFCSTVEDTTDLTGVHAERWRRWDSCFNLDFSYIHGGSVRTSAAARYRQWLTHKLATWQDQFGVIGCVGCGRCITWCPVGIDLTREVEALRSSVDQLRKNRRRAKTKGNKETGE